MILDSLSTLQWILLGLGIVTVVTVLGLGYLYHRERRRAAEAVASATSPEVAIVENLPDVSDAAAGDVDADRRQTLSSDDELVADGGSGFAQAQHLADDVRLESPEIKGSLSALLGVWRHRMKEKKMARKGYIKWFKVGANVSRPRWIKPFRNGQGELIYYDDGDPYLFPKNAMATDSQTGAYVAVHREGDALPVDLTDPAVEGLPVDKFRETIDLSVESDSPGWFQKMDIDNEMLLYGGIAVMLVLGAVAQFMGGGL